MALNNMRPPWNGQHQPPWLRLGLRTQTSVCCNTTFTSWQGGESDGDNFLFDINSKPLRLNPDVLQRLNRVRDLVSLQTIVAVS